MHPMVLESLTEQRLEDLRSGISGMPGRSDITKDPTRAGISGATPTDGGRDRRLAVSQDSVSQDSVSQDSVSRDPVRVGPVGRTQARMGLWMVETGSRLVRNAGGSADTDTDSASDGKAA